MGSFVVTWRELLLVLLLVLVFYIAELLLLMRTGRKKEGPTDQGTAIAANYGETLKAVREEIVQLQEQVARLEGEVERLKSAQQVAAPYAHVVQMARQGLDVNELAASCGISRGEAELIVALQQKQAQDREGTAGT